MKKVILTIIIVLTGMITAQAQRFALIDMEYILKHIPAYEQANRQMESLSQQYQKEIEAKGQEAKSLYEAYQQSASTLSDSQRNRKGKRYRSQRKGSSRPACQIFRSGRRNGQEAEGTDYSHPGCHLQCRKDRSYPARLRCGIRPRLGPKHDICLPAHRYQQ